MTTWIDEQLAKRQALKERSALIAQHAIPIYEDLWKRLVEFVEEAKLKGFPLTTNGSLQNRVVILVSPNPPTFKRDEFHVVLEKESIVARGSIGSTKLNLMFPLDVCHADGVVCLK